MVNKRRWLLTNWFSNFDPLKNPIIDDYNIKYSTVERAYQANKTLNKEERLLFTDTNKTESEIKRLGNSIVLREDWETKKLQIMYNLVYQKYFRNPDHKKELIRSHPYEIVEWNRWHDNFWGCCVCPRCTEKKLKSSNYLGKILMKVRAILINGEISNQ